MPTTLLLATPDFQTFLRPCIILHIGLCRLYENNARFMNLNFEYHMNIEYLYCM